MNHGGGCAFDFGRVKYVPAIHSSSFPDGSYAGNPGGFVVETREGNFYYAGDTALTMDMKLIGEATPLRFAALPIGDNFTMGPADALRAVKLLKPKIVIPIHFNTWDLIHQDANQWAVQVKAETGAEVHVLKPGESFTLD